MTQDEAGRPDCDPKGDREYGDAPMDTTSPSFPETLQELPPRLRAELLRHLRCTDEARAEERERLRPDPVMAAWVELLDELESGGPLMREVVRDTIDDSS
jgi:hypothetical protein